MANERRFKLIQRWVPIVMVAAAIFWGVWSLVGLVPSVESILLIPDRQIRLPFAIPRGWDVPIWGLYTILFILFLTENWWGRVGVEGVGIISYIFATFGLVFGLVGAAYGQASGLLVALVIGLVFTTIFVAGGGASGLVFGLTYGLITWLAFGPPVGLVLGLVFGLIYFLRAYAPVARWLTAKD